RLWGGGGSAWVGGPGGGGSGTAYAAMAGGSSSAARNGAAPSEGEPFAAEAERPMLAAAVSSSSRLRSAIGRKFEPNSVSVTLRVVRSNNRNPSCDSSSRTSTLIPDWVMKSCSAAREKLW